MTTVPTVAVPLRTRESRSWLALARVEAIRFARHPLFLAGLATGVGFHWLLVGSPAELDNPDRLNSGIVAIFVGLVGMLVAFRRTTALRSSAEVVIGAPMSDQERSAALVVACVVPFTAGLLGWAFTLWSLDEWPLPAFATGGLTHTDVIVLTAIQTAIPSLGGPLLGVAAGRWLRFRGAAVVLLVLVVAWVVGVGQFVLQGAHASTAGTALRLLTPFAFFQTTNQDSTLVETFPGSIEWFAGWQLGLCAMAVAAALLKDSTGRSRRRILISGWVLLVPTIACYLLAVRGGHHDIVTTFRDGTSVIGRP